ncbi:1-acyl-sn-glycerol-3-phosphate acyltransferase [Rubrivirga sp.]|uniref:1-acyl-sn-glycerol-3-phosphate acyltransferase n=1 Tax=Rubrivirga sp. TaxID=1885344 RepID=UPI003C75C4F4
MSARPDGIAARLARRFADRTIRGELRSGLRRVVGVGGIEDDPAPGRPLVVYANHHVYPDSFLLWLLTTQVWRRPMVVWMEAWDRAPLFGPVGALPFPDDDPKRRLRTIRETARRMAADPTTALYLYPEGTMRIAGDGLGPFRADLPRLARILPDAAWVPVGIATEWWGEARPTAVMAIGDVHDAPDGDERSRLLSALEDAHAARPTDDLPVLFQGTAGADERWDLSRTVPFFERLTFGR